jgi:hypothetical protein
MSTESDSTTAGARGNEDGSYNSGVLPECDLVMKGGITSGVVYPKLVSRLSKHYQFKNVGGTSAGAIAAGACAAAEYGRKHGNHGAFTKLGKLPHELQKKTPPSNRSKLFTLFQPTKELRKHFAVLVAPLNVEPVDAIQRVLIALLRMHPVMLVVGVLLGMLLVWPLVQAQAPVVNPAVTFGVAAVAFLMVSLGLLCGARIVARSVMSCGLAAVLIAVAVAVALAVLLRCALGADWSWGLAGVAVATEAISIMVLALLLLAVVGRFGATLLDGLHRNCYGICTGRTADSTEGAPIGLTDWLASYFNEIAGFEPGHRPLTFGDLWGTQDANAPRQINLEVMTSAISQQMVYGIPFREDTQPFYYDPDEWASLFPPNVLCWLKDAAAENPGGDGSEPLPTGACVTNAAGKALHALPRRADLPIVVAVRMSLSFPILLSAVPLYSIDWSRKENQSKKDHLKAAAKSGTQEIVNIKATKVWFSDGGIGSNMPLHMFDALLPGHPTFAVNLKAQHPDFEIAEPEQPDNKSGRIYLPHNTNDGRLRHWPEPKDDQPLGGLLGFLLSIVNTMQDWRDEILFPYPGFRDRIVQISQRPTEGGLNLDMPEKRITDLANAGEMAADRLVDRFNPSGIEKGCGWTDHQRTRLATFLGTMQPVTVALQPSLKSGLWTARVRDIKGYRSIDRTVAVDFLNGLEALGAQGSTLGVSLEGGADKPLAQIRITPRI